MEEDKEIQADPQLHEQLGKAIQAWIEITGVPLVNKKRMQDRNDYEVGKTYNQLAEAQELDPTGLTACMLLKSFFVAWASDRTISLMDAMLHQKSTAKAIEQIQNAIKHLRHPYVRRRLHGYRNSLRASCKAMGATHPQMNEFLGDQYTLGYIRRDAFKAVEKLTAHQFTYGECSTEPFGWNPSVWQFWNINSMLRMGASNFHPGVNVVLIRDADAIHSYFLFLIRNGGNMIVLTDKTEVAHPLQREMSRGRREDKVFAERAFKWHFPYQLLEYCFFEKSVTFKDKPGLVLYQTETVKLGKIADLEPDQVIWMAQVFNLLKWKFWDKRVQLPEPSYTGEMVKEPTALSSTVNTAIMKAPILEVKPITLADVTSESTAELFRRKPHGHNRWMEDRYLSTVDPAHLNRVGTQLLLPDAKQERWGKTTGITMKALDPTEFGTEAMVRRDIKFLARYNACELIERAAQEEYDKLEKETVEWFCKNVLANADRLIEAMARGVFISEAQGEKPGESFDFSQPYKVNLMRVFYSRLYWGPDGMYNYAKNRAMVDKGHSSEGWAKRLCYITGQKAKVYGDIMISTPQGVADVCGTTVDKLPWPLQRFNREEPYGGNNILDMVDPLDFIRNPWRKLDLGVRISLSCQAYNDVRSKLGLFKITKWETLPPTREKDHAQIKDGPDPWPEKSALESA